MDSNREQQFFKFPDLKTKRLELKEVNSAHYTQLEELISFHPGDKSTRSVNEVLEKTKQDYMNKTGITWGMFLNNELIGTCGYYRGFTNNIGEVGYVMRAGFRRQHYMSEALLAVVKFGFKKLELEKIIALTEPTNEASVTLLTQNQFSPTDITDGKFQKFELNKEDFVSDN